MATQVIPEVELSVFSKLSVSDREVLSASLACYRQSLVRRIKAEPDSRIKAIVGDSVDSVDRLSSNLLKVSS